MARDERHAIWSQIFESLDQVGNANWRHLGNDISWSHLLISSVWLICLYSGFYPSTWIRSAATHTSEKGHQADHKCVASVYGALFGCHYPLTLFFYSLFLFDQDDLTKCASNFGRSQ